jgi:hypothetical protein
MPRALFRDVVVNTVSRNTFAGPDMMQCAREWWSCCMQGQVLQATDVLEVLETSFA